MRLIPRPEYLEWFIRWQGHPLVKVVSGVRRSGKSTMLDIFIEHLRQTGVRPDQIIRINFEDVENEPLADYRRLVGHVTERLSAGEASYVFLDEVQQVEQFERAVASLLLQPGCDIYITGSNAYFMSSELATLLSGRYVELRMLPLSFKEFSLGLGDAGLTEEERFNLYITVGSFPYAVNLAGQPQAAREYLRDIFNSVLLKDIVARLGVADVANLENVTRFLLHNIGSPVSMNKIANTLRSAGKGVDNKTVDKYVRGLTDSLLFYEARRYDIKGRSHLTSLSKYYCVDVALRDMLVRGSESDIGHILENIVYLELRRRGFDVYVGQLGQGEVDFVAIGGDGVSYYQVSASTLDEAVLARELNPLRSIPDNHPKYLLTLDELFKTADYDGIRKLNVLEWLTGA